MNPLFAYLGDAVNEQKAVSAFLRNGLNPILQNYGCGLILVHHTNKPATGKEKPDWRAGDFAYLGAGTAELANWARAVMGIPSLGSHTIFSVELAKRGRRAGVVDDNGEPVYRFYIKHAERRDDEPQSASQLHATRAVRGGARQPAATQGTPHLSALARLPRIASVGEGNDMIACSDCA